MIKKITFVGNFGVDFSSESHYRKTFEKLGIQVIPLQENNTTADIILKSALASDMLFWVHTHAWKIEGMKEVLRKLKVAKIPTVGYHLDLWLGINREKDLDTDEYWDIEYFFSVDPQMVDLLNSRDDMPKAYFLRAGVFEDECYMGERREHLANDVIFVGSRGYHPEWPYRAKLVDWLQDTYGTKFSHYGGDGLQVIRGKELNDLYASAKVVVGDTLCKDFKYPQYLSDRIFETTGRGGFIIHPFIEGVEECFDLTKEIVTYKFDDFRQLKSLIDFYVNNNAARLSIQIAGHERTKRDHTYSNRLKYLLDTVQKNTNK